MFCIFCFIIVVVAAQPVISGSAKDVNEAYIQPIELSKGLTKTTGNTFGNKEGKAKVVDTTDTVVAAIEAILDVGGIAFVRSAPNYIVVSANLVPGIKTGYCFRYDLSQTSRTTSRGFDIAHVKIVTSVKTYNWNNKDHVKIFYEALECTSSETFGDLELHFGTVETGIVNVEKSNTKVLKEILMTKFSELKKKYVGTYLTPEFENLTLNPAGIKSHEVLRKLTGKITGFVVTKSTKTDDKATSVEITVNDEDTILQLAYGSRPITAQHALKDPNFNYNIAVQYTAE